MSPADGHFATVVRFIAARAGVTKITVAHLATADMSIECTSNSAQPLCGLEPLIDSLVVEAVSQAKNVPILVFGILPHELVERRVDAAGGRSRDLWKWPGFSYLQYGINRDDLALVARRVHEGAKQALPNLRPTLDDVVKLLDVVQHWLKNYLDFRRNRLRDLAGAARGETEVLPAHFIVRCAIREDHERDLVRLWEMEALLARQMESSGAIAALKAQIAAYRLAWTAVEEQLAQCRNIVQNSLTLAPTQLALAEVTLTEAVDQLQEAYRIAQELFTRFRKVSQFP